MAPTLKKRKTRGNKLNEKSKPLQIPRLDRSEQIELQNIMLRLALEGERIRNFESEIKTARGEIIRQKGYLTIWKDKFNTKLSKYGITIEQVDIDAETGVVNISDTSKIIGDKNASSSN